MSIASLPYRTRIKICGLRQPEHVEAAAGFGADAIGFVFYAKSPRAVTPAQAAALARRLPPFVTAVGLFVNPSRAEVQAVLDQVPLGLLQFHGDESEADCSGFAVPYMRAARISMEGSANNPAQAQADLVEFIARYPNARAILLDALVDGYGGGGKVFNWSVIPKEIARRAVLSGGLNAQNVADALARVRPYAVDVSSGVERERGVKDTALIRAFIAAVQHADQVNAASAADAAPDSKTSFPE